jgi:porin
VASKLRLIVAGVAACVSLASMAMASEPAAATATQESNAAATDKPAAGSQGILPIPDYSGDLWTRQYLTGDWGGARGDLARHGLQFNIDFTQTVQSVVDGGADTGTRYGGTLDYNLTLDLYRMGVLPGAMVKFRAETRYGEAVNDLAGPIIPVNADGFFPIADPLDDDVPIAVTNLTYYQFLSEQLGFLVGKIDTLDADPNEFASGRGTRQFMNTNFVVNPVCLPVAPYATLGTGIIVRPIPQITVSSLIFNTSEASTTSGFEGFGEGWTWATEADFQYRLFSLHGGQNVGFMLARDQDFFDFDARFVFQPGQGLTRPTEDESWSLYWSGWQYVWSEASQSEVLDPTNGKPDLKGIGLFWRAGTADSDTNPIDWTASGGIGARGLIPTRDHDTLGVGYFFGKIQNGRIASVLDLAEEVEGWEVFYNLAITPAVQLTFDAQVVDDLRPNTDTAVVLGSRLNVRF